MGEGGGLPGAKPPSGTLTADSKSTGKKKKYIYIYIYINIYIYYIYIYRMAKFIWVCQYNVALNPNDLFGQPIISILGRPCISSTPLRKTPLDSGWRSQQETKHIQKGGPAR